MRKPAKSGFDGDWPSTKALSVWNMLSVEGRDLLVEEIVSLLRRHWHPRISLEYVLDGVRFLELRGMVKNEDGRIRLQYQRHTHTGAAPRAMKTRDERELVIYPTRPGLTWGNVPSGPRVY